MMTTLSKESFDMLFGALVVGCCQRRDTWGIQSMYYTQIVMHLFSMSNKSHHVMGHETDQRIANLPQLDELD